MLVHDRVCIELDLLTGIDHCPGQPFGLLGRQAVHVGRCYECGHFNITEILFHNVTHQLVDIFTADLLGIHYFLNRSDRCRFCGRSDLNGTGPVDVFHDLMICPHSTLANHIIRSIDNGSKVSVVL